MKRALFAFVVIAGLIVAWSLLRTGPANATEGISRRDAESAEAAEDVSMVSPESARTLGNASRSEAVSVPAQAGAPSETIAAEETPLEAGGLVVKELDGGTLIEGAVALKGVQSGLGRELPAAGSDDLIDGPSATDGHLSVPISTPLKGRLAGEVVTIKAPGFAQTVITIGPQHVPPAAPVEAFLKRGGNVEGTVTVAESESYSPDDLRVEFAARLGEVSQPEWSLQFGGEVTWTSRVSTDGSFCAIDLVPNKRLKAGIYHGDKLLWSAPEPLTVRAGDTETVSWSVGGGSTVRIQATEASGGPAAGVKIMLDSPPKAASVTTGRRRTSRATLRPMGRVSAPSKRCCPALGRRRWTGTSRRKTTRRWPASWSASRSTGAKR